MSKGKNYLRLHIIVLIFGFTAIIGELLTLSAVNLVWYRIVFTVTALFFYLRLKKIPLRVPLKEAGKLLLTGLVVGLHWICFYQSIKVSTISIALISFSTVTIFTGLLEPLIFKRRISMIEILMGVIVLIGISIIFQFEKAYTEGILWGIGAAITSAAFVVANGLFAKRQNAVVISFYEMLGAFALLTVIQIVRGNMHFSFLLNPSDLILLLILSLVCTAFAFVVSVDIMRELSPFMVNLTINLEPVYGIILSLLIFGESEFMSPGFYLGTFIILLCVLIYPIFKYRLLMPKTIRNE